MTPEFSRLLPVDRVPEAGLEEQIEADDKERAALARRFDLPEIRKFAGDFHIRPLQRGQSRSRGR